MFYWLVSTCELKRRLADCKKGSTTEHKNRLNKRRVQKVLCIIYKYGVASFLLTQISIVSLRFIVLRFNLFLLVKKTRVV